RKLKHQTKNKLPHNISINRKSIKKRDQILDTKQAIISDYIAQVKHSFEQLDAETTKKFIESVLNEYSNPEQYEIVLGEKTRDILNNSLQVKAPVSNETVAEIGRAHV